MAKKTGDPNGNQDSAPEITPENVARTDIRSIVYPPPKKGRQAKNPFTGQPQGTDPGRQNSPDSPEQ